MKKSLLLICLLCSYSFYAQFQVQGKIVDQHTQHPLAEILIESIDHTVQTQTDAHGRYTIVVHKGMLISGKGYLPTQVLVSSSQTVNITLQPAYDQLDEVVIQTNTLSQKLKHTPEAITVISSNDIQRTNTVDYAPILNKVPGVFMQNGAPNTNKISIRGIGARNLFGTANIRAYYGDIPLTDGNGASAIEDIELNSLGQITIHKGPSSSSYGVGLGGTILLTPKKIPFNTTNATTGYLAGSYGLQKSSIGLAHNSHKGNININYSNTHIDGYRQNNTYNRSALTATGEININKANELTFIGTHIDLKAFIPSSLNQEDFDNDPRTAAFTWGRAQGFEDTKSTLLGLSWKHLYNTTYTQYTSVFGTLKDNYEPRPFNILEENATTFGVRSRIIGTHHIGTTKIKWTAGGELFTEQYNGRTYANLSEDFPIGTGSIQGDLLSDLDERRSYYNLFTEINIQPSKRLHIQLGIHANQTSYDIKDQIATPLEDTSGNYDFDPIVSPKIGLTYNLKAPITLYTSIAHGFSPPSSSETITPDGSFNPDIQPETGWNMELGSRFHFFNNTLYGSIALYRLQVQNLLVSRRTPEDAIFAVNAGKTTHDGIELDLNYILYQHQNSKLVVFGNTAIYDYSFDEFIDLDADFSGNDLTGVPASVSNLGLDLITSKGIYGALNFQHVGRIPVNDQNSLYSNAYELLNGKIGYRQLLFKKLNFDIYMGVNNILDKKYASQIQINARGFGGNAPRYFYPGLPLHIFGGININYTF